MLATDPAIQQQMQQLHQIMPQLYPAPTPPANTAVNTATTHITPSHTTPPPPPPPPPPQHATPPPPQPHYTPTPPHQNPTIPPQIPPTMPPQHTPRIPTPNPPPATWKPDANFYDSNPLHGHPFHRQIQATAWSRAKNIQGLDPLTLPASTLMRHGQEEYALRLLSTGRYMGLIATRSIAESVMVSMMLKDFRDKGIFIDDIAQSLHQQAGNPVPSKKDQAIQYMQPLIDNINNKGTTTSRSTSFRPNLQNSEKS